jgi:uncharacterized protein YukE
VPGLFGNPDGLRALAGALTAAGTDVSTSASSIGGKVGVLTATKWTGGAAAAFQSHWSGEYTNLVDLGLSATTVARVLNDLAASLDQANQIVLQAAAQSAVQAAVGAATLNPVGAAASASSTMAAAVQQATQVAQRAWALATSQLSGVTVPTIGALTSPQQAAAWAQNALAPAPAALDLSLETQLGVNDPQWKNKQPPFPPLFPSLNTGGVWIEPQQPQPVPGPFPGGGWIGLQPSFNLSGGISVKGGGTSGIDWRWLLAAAAALAAGAAANSLFSNRAKRWQEILVGISLAGRLLGGAHSGPMTPLEQLLDKLGGTNPPKQQQPTNKQPGNQQGGTDPPPDGEFPPNDGQWHDDGSGGMVKRMPDGSVIRIGP